MQARFSEKRARTREKLLAAAVEAIGEKGFEAVSLDEIAARAGLTKGAIYDHFGSKDGVIRAVMEKEWKPIPFPEGAASAPVEARMRAFADQVVSQGDETRLRLPLQSAFLLYSLSHPELQAATPGRLKEGTQMEARRLLDVFKPEELPMAPDRFAILLQAMIPGLMYMRSQAPEVVTDEAIRDIFLGLLPKT
jgi:AcrR family transcriptional regulator